MSHESSTQDDVRRTTPGRDAAERIAALAGTSPQGEGVEMGDRENAAASLAHMPRWVAVHENTLAKLDVIVALAGAEGYDVDDMLAELDEARGERDRAIGIRPDERPDPHDYYDKG